MNGVDGTVDNEACVVDEVHRSVHNEACVVDGVDCTAEN